MKKNYTTTTTKMIKLSDIVWRYGNISNQIVTMFLFRQPVQTHQHFRHAPDNNIEHQFFGYHKDKMVAYAYLGTSTSFGYVVDKDYQGYGIGTECIRRVMNLAYEKNYTDIKTEVDTDNVRSKRMMQKVGFSMTKSIHQCYKDFRIPVLFITYNRLKYSVQAMHALLKTNHAIRIYVWDNGSTDGTVEWLRTIEKESKIDYMRYNPTNVGINKAFNEFIRRYRDCDFLAKIDNDTVITEDWIDKLLEVLLEKQDLDVIGAFMQRPLGWTFQEWVDSVMKKETFKENYLAYNSYTGGTGVMFRTKIFWEYGLLWEKAESMQGDWTTFQRIIFNNYNIAWYSGTTVKLLNIIEDGKKLSDDFPKYDEELRLARDAGNKWYSKIGGADGMEKLIEESGGRERLDQ